MLLPVPRAEISWKRRTPEGDTIRVYAQHFGNRWTFSARPARAERRQPIEHPPLEDWLDLLDGVRRRVGRGLLRPDEVGRLEQAIRERFPGVEI
ncbi:MAG: hypothetical protein E6J72_07890 [Deltaproteobacteria bacterium]|nr:MAG: hypothetical protein E6J72_07890 [Deltaproteobacteria bacterium]